MTMLVEDAEQGPGGGPDLLEAAVPPLEGHDRLAVLELLPELVLAIGDDFVIHYANQTLLDALGYHRDQLVGASVLDFVHPDDLANTARSLENRHRHAGEAGLTIQLRGRAADGSWIVADVVGRRLDDPGLPPVTVISMRLVDNAPALGSDPPRLRSIIDKAADIILLLDAAGTVLFANVTLTRRLDHDADVVVGQPWLQLLAPAEWDLAAARLAHLVDSSEREDEWRARLVDTAGNEVVHALRLVDAHDDPLVDGIIVTATEVTDLVAMEDQLRRQNDLLSYEATHDHVTGLVNRPEFRRLTSEALARPGGDVVVLFCDLDGFKRVNDRHGHDAGDRVLRIIAERLQHAVRRGDVVARWGGDEFTVLCGGGISAVEAEHLRDRVREVIGRPIPLEQTSVGLGVSVGLARLPARSIDADGLVDEADRAMYEEKRARPRSA
jgi:diguanylate cyclase (GGDEF)-like protein/PAS domain S-box-containing protein